MKRRRFLQLGALGSAALVLQVGPQGELALAAASAPFQPNAWVRIDPDGTVTLTVAKAEMGQGVRTSLAMILAEELGADWAGIRIIQAMPAGDMNVRTSGSSAVTGSWLPLRRAGAAARMMLIAAAAKKLGEPPAACRAEAGSVVHAPSGRRLRFGELAVAAAAETVPAEPQLTDPGEFRLVGQPIRRADGPDIVTGRAVYGLDVRPRPFLKAVVARSPVLNGTLRSFDATRALAVPGVRQVVRVPTGVAVLADDTWTAIQARDLLHLDWDTAAGEGLDSEQYRRALAETARGGGRASRDDGDAPAALAGAKRVLEALYEYPLLAHAALEPMNTAVEPRTAGLTIWCPTQAGNQVQQSAARALGVQASAVDVHVPLLGGGFGRRLAIDYAEEAVEVARAAGRAVHTVWTREDDLAHGRFQPASAHWLRGGLDDRGEVVALSHSVAYPWLTTHGRYATEDQGATEFWGAWDNPYAIPALRVEGRIVDPLLPTGPWRAVQYPSGVLARECFLDELAHAAGRDPLAVRLGLLEGPARELGEQRIDRPRLRRVLELCAEKAGWGRPLRGADGRGVALNVYHGRTLVAQVAEVSVDRQGLRVRRVVCAIDCGIAVNPLGLEGQVESGILWGLSALFAEITVAGGRVQQSGYGDFPVLALDRAPEVEVHVVPSREAPTGVGEQPVPPAAPAALNALFAATGRRLRRLPVSSEHLS